MPSSTQADASPSEASGQPGSTSSARLPRGPALSSGSPSRELYGGVCRGGFGALSGGRLGPLRRSVLCARCLASRESRRWAVRRRRVRAVDAAAPPRCGQRRFCVVASPPCISLTGIERRRPRGGRRAHEGAPSRTGPWYSPALQMGLLSIRRAALGPNRNG